MSEREILDQSIKDHQRAIDKAKKELKGLEVTYSIGDRFKYNGRKFILADSESSYKVGMVGLKDGIFYNHPSQVENFQQITSEEMGRMLACSGSFVRYWDSRKKVKT